MPTSTLALALPVVAIVVAAAAGCGDSTDIAGTYLGNATYTLSSPTGSGDFGAGSATITLVDAPDGVTVDIGSACELDAPQVEQLTIEDHSAKTNFVFTSDSVAGGQPCTLPLGAIGFGVTEGDLVVEHGLTMQLDIGGAITAAPDASAIGGYVVYQFLGEAR